MPANGSCQRDFFSGLIAFTRVYLEWLAGRGRLRRLPCGEAPGDGVARQGQRHPTWDLEDVGVERAGFWRANGQQGREDGPRPRAVERVGLTAPIAGVLGFRSTALAVGRDLADRASGSGRGRGDQGHRPRQVEGDLALGEARRLSVVSAGRHVGRQARRGHGPDARRDAPAARLRQAFKEGDAMGAAGEPPVPPPPPPPPPIAHATTSKLVASSWASGLDRGQRPSR